MDVALREGIRLRQKGSRAWACCPLHGEKTPSLCFYPDGRWYCFGCHRGGDAVDFLAALRGSKKKASCGCCGDCKSCGKKCCK